MNIIRDIEPNIRNKLFQNKIVIIYGSRQVGKTTLVKLIAKDYHHIYLNGDEPDVREKLSNKTSTELKNIIGDVKCVIIDEAQRINNIGITLKLLVDNFPEIQVIATGSSSFELANKIIEPLTGRSHTYYLYPFSCTELVNYSSIIEEQRLLEQRLIYGSYPEVVAVDFIEKAEVIYNIAQNYLYKDILNLYNIKNHDNLRVLLEALALQIGSQVSHTELSCLVGIDKNTIAHYIHLLEQAFIIFRLRPKHKNQRTELKKLTKIYFYDLGIRNSLIHNFNRINLRNDIGQLWENYLISERVKKNNYNGFMGNSFFWRNNNKAEIDYIEELGGEISAHEFKWKNNRSNSKAFEHLYPEAKLHIVNKDNYLQFIGPR